MNSNDNLLNNCCGIKLVTLSAALAGFIAEDLSLNDQNLLGNLLCGIGQNLLTIAAQNSKFQSCIQACKDNNNSET